MTLTQMIPAVTLQCALLLTGAVGPGSATRVAFSATVVDEDSGRFADWVAQLSEQQLACSATSTTILSEHEPGPVLGIWVVVHVITTSFGTGDIDDEVVQSQIEELNDLFLAVPGTIGEAGISTNIRFVMAKTDPDGQPTTGITRTEDVLWYSDRDEGGFKAALSWDTRRYLNIYTNSPLDPFYGGYAYLPQQGVVGTAWDGVVIPDLWFNNGNARMLAHLVGHYLGLYDTFSEGCGFATEPGCYSSGDLICDTSPDASAASGCNPGVSCDGYPLLIDNYMQHTNYSCADRFTEEQRNRMRCTLAVWRSELYRGVLFEDGFESGDTTAWSQTVP